MKQMRVTTGFALQKQLMQLSIPHVQILKFNIINSNAKNYRQSLPNNNNTKINNKQFDIYEILGRIKGINDYFGTSYEFIMFIDCKLGKPPIIAMKDPRFSHLLVKLGTGVFYIPGIENEWKKYERNLIYIIKKYLTKFEEYFNKSYSRELNDLWKQNIYPVNTYLWDQYKNNPKFYRQEIEKNKVRVEKK